MKKQKSDNFIYDIAANSLTKELAELKKIKKYLLSRDMHNTMVIEYLSDEIKDVKERKKNLKKEIERRKEIENKPIK